MKLILPVLNNTYTSRHCSDSLVVAHIKELRVKGANWMTLPLEKNYSLPSLVTPLFYKDRSTAE